jgi:hypothetical protein
MRDAVRASEAELIPAQQMIELLQAEINLWKADEQAFTNVTNNFVRSQQLRIAALRDENGVLGERINAGTDLVGSLEAEGLISSTTAGKLRDLAQAALTGKGSSTEFFGALNKLIEALGGTASTAETATGKTSARSARRPRSLAKRGRIPSR